MKKSLLLLIAGSIAVGAGAQERKMCVASGNNPLTVAINKAALKNYGKKANVNAAHKTTAAMDRWYSYVDYYDTSLVDASGSGVTINSPYLWNDTTSLDAYSNASGGTEYDHNRMVSMASILDPTYAGLNNYDYYTGEMKVTATDAYTVDSVLVFGNYGRNPAKLGVVDTLRISVLYGSGTSSSDIKLVTSTSSSLETRYATGATGLKYANINYDTARNTAKGTTVVTKTILLDTAAYRMDTNINGTFVAIASFTPINVPAGNMVSASVSFKSGDPAFTANDTVFKSTGTTGTYKYNMFRPLVAFNGTSTAPQFAPYTAGNYNDGVFKTLPDTSNGWTGEYIPMWFWSSSATGSTLQFPYMRFHLNCTTCTAIRDVSSVANVSSINEVTISPNPANTQLNVSFSVVTKGDVKVSLTNVVGQVVAAQTLTNVASGTAVINTTSMPAGVYFYTIMANGEQSTGRVLIAH